MKKTKQSRAQLTARSILLSLLVSSLGVLGGPAFAQQEKSGPKLWAENCGRCHNIRPPEERSERQWEIIMQHMRVRGYLTGKEARKILEFLKQAN